LNTKSENNANEQSADWALLSSFCDDLNLRISVFKNLTSLHAWNKQGIKNQSQILIENRFHIKLRIISPYILFKWFYLNYV